MKPLRRGFFWTFACLMTASAVAAEDVSLRLAPGDGFVITDSTGANEHLRIDETTGDLRRGGQLFLPMTEPTSLFLGVRSVGQITSGLGNTGIGWAALASLDGPGAVENSALGVWALRANTNGGRNAAFGAYALSGNTTGVGNSAFGSFALFNQTDGNTNSAFGANALRQLASGEDNTALGSASLMFFLSGSGNIAIGELSGFGLDTGDDNIYLGSPAGSAREFGQIHIGTPGTHSHTFLTGTTSTTGRLGVGTDTPNRELTISDTDESGDAALNLVASSPDGREMVIAVNQSTGGLISMQTNNALDFRTNANSRFHITADGKVGIETTTPSHPFVVASANGAHVTAGGTWTNGSSRSFKEGFEAVDSAEVLDRVASLPIARWRYRGEATEGEHLGPVAEDFHAAFGLGGDERYIATVDADGVALAAIQGLHALVEEQSSQIRAQEGLIEALLERVQALEALRGARK